MEKLNFKIKIAGTFWDKKPKYSVWIDDIKISDGQAELEDQVIEFNQELGDGMHSIKIRLENKENSDTVENEDKTSIVKDMLLDIKNISIDEIDLGQLIWTNSRFEADDKTKPVIKNCVNLGWNGTYILEFNSPFYIWLLENI